MPEKKLNHEEFCLRAIEKLRKEPYKGIHVVYSGFNNAFKEYFGVDAREITDQLQREGKIRIVPCKGGAIMYKPEDAPNSTTGALSRMGL
jgi:hypothetical protein